MENDTLKGLILHSERVVRLFLESDASNLRDYCDKHYIKPGDLNYYAKILMTENTELYNAYVDKVNTLKKEADYQRLIKPLNTKKNNYLRDCELLKEYINGNYRVITEFSKDYNLTIDGFKKGLNNIKANNSDIYAIYDEYIAKDYIYNNDDIKAMTRILLGWLKDGIDLNGKRRPLNLLDYYMATNISIFDIELYIIKNPDISNSDRRNFIGFKRKMVSVDHYLNDDKFIKMTMDTVIKNGNGELKIDNSGKEKIFNFLKNNNLPVFLFQNVMEEYLNQEIDLDKVYAKYIPNHLNEIENEEHRYLINKINKILANDVFLNDIENQIKSLYEDIINKGTTLKLK